MCVNCQAFKASFSPKSTCLYRCARKNDQSEFGKGGQGESHSKRELEGNIFLQGRANIDVLGILLDPVVRNDMDTTRLQELKVEVLS